MLKAQLLSSSGNIKALESEIRELRPQFRGLNQDFRDKLADVEFHLSNGDLSNAVDAINKLPDVEVAGSGRRRRSKRRSKSKRAKSRRRSKSR